MNWTRALLIFVFTLTGCHGASIYDFTSGPKSYIRDPGVRDALISESKLPSHSVVLADVKLSQIGFSDNLLLVAANKESKYFRFDLVEPKTNTPGLIVYQTPDRTVAIDYQQKIETTASPGSKLSLPILNQPVTLPELFGILVGKLPEDFIKSARLYRTDKEIIVVRHNGDVAVLRDNKLIALELEKETILQFMYEESDTPEYILLDTEELNVEITPTAYSEKYFPTSKIVARAPKNFSREFR